MKTSLHLFKNAFLAIIIGFVAFGCSPEQFSDPNRDADPFSPTMGASINGMEDSNLGSKTGLQSQSATGSQSVSATSSEDGGDTIPCPCVGGLTELTFRTAVSATINVYNEFGVLIATFPNAQPLDEFTISANPGTTLGSNITLELINLQGIEVIVLDTSCATDILGTHGNIDVLSTMDSQNNICP